MLLWWTGSLVTWSTYAIQPKRSMAIWISMTLSKQRGQFGLLDWKWLKNVCNDLYESKRFLGQSWHQNKFVDVVDSIMDHVPTTNSLKQPVSSFFHGFEMHRCLTSHSMAPERLIPPPAAANTTHRAPHQKISKMRAFGSDALPGAGSFHTARQCGIVTFIAPLAIWHWDICACVLMCLLCPGALACCWLHRPSRV